MSADRLFDLLPVHVRARDDGLLEALLSAVAGELDILEHDTDELYASWFIETCPEWVVPYLADLVGVPELPPPTASRRAFVANTVAYRRRKGTVGVIEQVARDVTGWPAVAVEYYRLLAAAAHTNHVRLDRPATADLRDQGRLEAVVPPLAHTADVRHIASGRGRHNIGHVGVLLFDDQVYDVTCPARDVGDGWTAHPVGWDAPLYAAPTAEAGIEAAATEENLPVPLRPRRLHGLLAAGNPPLAVEVDGQQLAAERLRVCGLDDLAALPGWQVMVDPVRGRLHPYFDGAPTAPDTLSTTHVYGAGADVGAGTYDRAASHADALADDPFPGEAGVRAQVEADASIAGAVSEVAAGWAGGTHVVSIPDSGTYAEDVSVHVPEATRLVLVAAAWPDRVLGPGEVLPPQPGVYAPLGVRPHLRGTLRVTGDGGSAVVLDGLLVEGDVIVGPGSLASLTLAHCTVTGEVRIGAGPVATNPGVRVRVLRSITGGLRFGPGAAVLQVRDSVVDSATAITGAGLSLGLDGTTVRGRVGVRSLTATSSILDGPAVVEDRQVGCVRFSYVEPGSRVPRRFRCASDVPPQYRATAPGSPHRLTLAGPPQISTGGEDASEMGVHHHLHRPARVRAAYRLLADYVPVGIEIGVASNVATGRG